MAKGLCRAALALCVAAGAAQAELRLCNETGEAQSIALGYSVDDGWASRGWWNIAPGACEVLLPDPLEARYYYYLADSQSGSFRGQNYVFCTQDRAFDITGDEDCEGRGFEAADFREIDTGPTAKRYTVTMRAAGSPGAGQSAVAPGGAGVGAASSIAVVPPPSQTPGQTPGQTLGPLPEPSRGFEPLAASLQPGAHGRAFAEPAVFQGCALERGRAFCAFYLEGLREVRVYYGGPTPNDLLYALEALPAGQSVALEGDLVRGGGSEQAIVVRRVGPGAADSFSVLRAALQGDWTSEADRLSEITIRGAEIYVRYEGDYQTLRRLELAARCEGARGAGPFMLQRGEDDRRAACYMVEQSGDRLRLDPVAGGTALRFTRS